MILGLLLVAIGFVGDFCFLIQWGKTGYGELEAQSEMRWAILFTTLLIVGVEVFFASFFMSMLGISRDHYVGDYTSGE